MPEILIFVYKKEDNKFQKYQIISKEIEEVKEMVAKYNESGPMGLTAKIIEREDIRDAILQKESSASIKSYCKDVVDSIESLENNISIVSSEFESFMRIVNKQLDGDQ